MSKRIAIDARVINSSTGRYIERLLHYLEELDTTNDYLILVRAKDLNYYQPKNPRFKVVEAEFADYSFSEQLGLAKFLRRLQPDLVHFCMPQQPLLFRGTTITTVHDLNLLRITSNDDMNWLELRIKKFVFASLLRRVARRSQHIITPSQYTKDDLVRFAHIPAEKVSVTYEGADTATSTPQVVPTLEGKQFLLYVGRAEPYKNNRGVIKAHQELLHTHPDLRMVIVGNKDVLRQADMRWVAKNGYKNVDFLGFVSDEELAWLYTNCAAYVFPSFMEGFGLPGLEAMAYGAPVVSSNATSLPEVYKNGAEYFDPHSIEGMAGAIEKVLQNPQRRAELIAAGTKVHGEYSWRRMAEQTLAIYRNYLS